MKLIKFGQTTLEFVILLVIMIGVFLSMHLYVKRGIQGRWKSTIDDFGDQYDPRLTNSNVVYTTNGVSATQIQTIKEIGGFWTQRNDNSNMTTSTDGVISVGGQAQ